MPEAPRSPDEARRLETVQALRLLGTPAEERFDRITRLAQRVFNVPMAAIDIVGDKMAWLKSVQGFDGIEGIRKDSYCHHTVLSDEICLIPDARKDSRVFDSDFATTWVFYAGAPLHFGGQRIGVLCIGDTKPRHFERDHLQTLHDLASLVEDQFHVAALSEAQIALALSNEELSMKSQIDVLTHAWNRGAILQLLENAIGSGPRVSGIAALMIDIDHFKEVNDRYGHLVGDHVLRVISERLRKAIRPTDALGRYGGEEFLAVLANVNAVQAAEIGQRVCEVVAATPVRFEGHSIPVSCSVGCAVSDTPDSRDTLIRRADRALYDAKEKGRNRAELDGAMELGLADSPGTEVDR